MIFRTSTFTDQTLIHHWIKHIQDWPANVQKRKAEEKEHNERERRQTDDQTQGNEPKEEDGWRRASGQNKHHDAYASGSDEGEGQRGRQKAKRKQKEKSKYEMLREKYTPQEIALLRNL